MKLKKYTEYYNKILDYCNNCSITVQIKDGLEGEGLFFPYNRIIQFDSKLEESNQIAVLLHEIGHFIDFQSEKFAYNVHHSVARDSVSSKKSLTKAQYLAILDNEASAWKNSRIVAKQLKINLGKWFDKEEQEGFESYKNLKTRFKKENLKPQELKNISL